MLMLGLPCLASATQPQAGANGADEAIAFSNDRETYVLNPIESVSISPSSVWTDNRHRVYYSSEYVDGYLLFDISAVPDNAEIVAMTLRCYLENAYGSPNGNPVVDVHYSANDGWTRYTVGPGGLSLGALLVDDVPFSSYITYYDFALDVSAHDWAVDLADDQICFGFRNDVNYYSYVYFFGAYGDPVGPPPELTIEIVATPVGESSWSSLKAIY
jgi:hypothetical protein